MEGRSGSSNNPPANATGTTTVTTELEALQKQHEEKVLKIQELKKQVESTKLGLEEKEAEEKKNVKEISDERKQLFNSLCEKYNILREEYNALLAEKSKDE